VSLDLFGKAMSPRVDEKENEPSLPSYASDIKVALENVLLKANLSIWLMIDRLDEV
jgi:hypothetical protein